MKVFDFTNGTKGELLGSIKVVGYCSGWFKKGVSGKVYRITLTEDFWGDDVEVMWASGAGHTDHETGKQVEINPEDFGVDAVAFCTGQYTTGLEKGTWNWYVIGTKEWNRAALKSGILSATQQE